MTKEEKAQKIIDQNGSCYGVSCNPREANECPCYTTCPGGGTAGYPKNLKACQDFLASSPLWRDAPEWANSCVIEWQFREAGEKRQFMFSGIYMRVLPKSSGREIAEEMYEKMITKLMTKDECIALIEAGIHKYEKEIRQGYK